MVFWLSGFKFSIIEGLIRLLIDTGSSTEGYELGLGLIEFSFLAN